MKKKKNKHLAETLRAKRLMEILILLNLAMQRKYEVNFSPFNITSSSFELVQEGYLQSLTSQVLFWPEVMLNKFEHLPRRQIRFSLTQIPSQKVPSLRYINQRTIKGGSWELTSKM